ncbi:tRNA (cytidine/uridine-2'-O-)-methyltransferase TrmJ [Edaphobacter acidisoli]|uniref:tRNA (Cytidine/uridine-2'-O-)-methyltransferase TrmJ n=1 Tax=Edaphobacter acidisoli TaxID=2040573 RepID=A0A916RWS6_9BACT|nr:TrmH family RNA methyltransferase [Edaphobacter acidisoli]GGA72941.1 tRNA (cytidine/uridine-2'-O-)-methyltransferase TrmJ [Edaphobacter acidisoli]
MLSCEHAGRVTLVLVRARNPNNIGAVARAMHDFGFGDLRIVNDYSVPFEAARSAVDASDVLATARTFESVGAAVEDCTLVVGTTAVGERALQHRLYTLAEAAPLVRGELAREDGAGRVALLFGSEKTGLSNEELSHCTWLMTIPMQEYEDARHPSMNLGQAAAVCLYELVRQGGDAAAPADTDATAGERERLTVLLTEVLRESGYTERHPANCSEEQMRRLVTRMGVSAGDAPVWMGILRQVLWKLRGTDAK